MVKINAWMKADNGPKGTRRDSIVTQRKIILGNVKVYILAEFSSTMQDTFRIRNNHVKWTQ